MSLTECVSYFYDKSRHPHIATAWVENFKVVASGNDVKGVNIFTVF